jgi:hypothetical protein
MNVMIKPVLHDMSQLLNTDLDKETLATCIGMIESGVNPEALAVWFRFSEYDWDRRAHDHEDVRPSFRS